MRLALAAASLAFLASALPSDAQARDYPWCSRTSGSGYEPSCTFTSFRQCMATVSGQAGDCMQNPRMAFRATHLPN